MNRDFASYDDFFYKNATDELLEENIWIATKLKQLLSQKTAQILDFGCGSGEWLKLFSSYSNNVYACDISLSAINYCKKSHNCVNFFLFDGNSIPLLNESMDIVVCFWVIQEILEVQQLEKIFGEFSRILNANGLLLLIENKYSDIRSLVRSDKFGDLMRMNDSIIRQFPNNSATDILAGFNLKCEQHLEKNSIFFEVYCKSPK